MKKNILMVSFLTLILSGCVSLAPEYDRSQNLIPERFPNSGIYSEGNLYEKENVDLKETGALDWNNYINNEKLQKVIELALLNNKDLKIAQANISAAYAQYGISDSNRFPVVEAGGQLNRVGNNDSVGSTYQADIGLAFFEIDFFNRMKNLSDAALESFLSTVQAQKVTNLMVIAETSKAYFNVALAKSEEELALRTEKNAQESLRIISLKVENGIATDKDLSDAQTIYYQAQADVAMYQSKLAQSINALNLLSGSMINESLYPNSVSEVEDSINDIKIALSSEVLYERPDVLMAENQLKAAYANIGAAKAAFFPRITLTTAAGFASSELSGLFSGDNKMWSFIPSISIPIFNRGLVASLKYSEAQRELYLATYEKTIEVAFKEVLDSLARKSTIDRQLDSYEKLLSASQRSEYLAQITYDNGVSDYLGVLTAQNNLYSIEKNYLAIKKEKLDNLINFYKVIAY